MRLLSESSWTFLAVVLLLAPPALAARLALVIGNSAYTSGPLKNPVNDAIAVSAELRKLNFEVTTALNLRRDDIGRTLENFAQRIRPGDDVVFFYAGHGVQVKGVNFLPAVDANIKVEADVPLNSVNLSQWVDRLDESKAGVRLLIIDACRDNPYARTFRSASRGLARIENAPTGTLMHFATRPGGVADDGVGVNGLYTAQLLKHMRTPDLAIESLLKRVTADVRQVSLGAQIPWMEGALEGDFYLFPRSPGKPGPTRPGANTAGGPTSGVAAEGSNSAARVVQTDCEACPVMTLIASGRFAMGTPDFEAERRPNEGPVREVVIGRSLLVGKYEVTRAEFAKFAGSTGYVTDAERNGGCRQWTGRGFEVIRESSWRNPGFLQSDSHPAVCISWNDAQSYLSWINELTQVGWFRLLSEAEWEYVARAGQGTERYPWGDDPGHSEICKWANGMDQSAKPALSSGAWNGANCRDGFTYTAPGEALHPNQFGVHNMLGNAWEWVQDSYRDSYEGGPADGSAWDDGAPDARRVLRGGGWYANPWFLRSADRTGMPREYSDASTGFRIARDVQESKKVGR